MFNLDPLLFEESPSKEGYVSRCKQIRPTQKCQVTIPKKIMQTWKTSEVPEKWKVSPLSIKEIMWDWGHILMNDIDNRAFVEEYFPDFLPYYDAFPYNIQRADAIRYCWLYIHGGIYMDLDFEVQVDLSSLFTSNNDIYLVKSGNVGSYYTNSFMASKPRCKFWLEVIEEMKKPLPWYYMGKHVVVMNTTGPIMLSHVVKKSDVVIGNLPSKYIMPCSICNINCSTCDSYLRPLEGSSWIGWDTSFYNFWLCNYRIVIAFLICLLLIFLLAFLIRKTGVSKDELWPPSKMYQYFYKSRNF